MNVLLPQGWRILFAENSGNFFVSCRISDTVTVTRPIDDIALRKVLLTLNPELLHCQSANMQLAIDALVSDSFHNHKKSHPDLKGLRWPYATDVEITKTKRAA